jgi:sugar/nucleoside kinase (ribokinase family)
MKSLDLLTIGDSSIDQFMKVEEGSADELQGEICFLHGSKVPIESFDTSIAGNALNVAVGTTLLEVKTAIYTEIGDDVNADRIINELKHLDIATDFCIKNKGTLTDVHPIVVYNNDRTIFIYHAKRNYKLQNWPTPKWIYYSSIGKDFGEFQNELIDYIKSNPTIGIAFNPGTYHLKAGLAAIGDFLKVTHLLIVNREEAVQLVGDGKAEELHKKLQNLGPKLTVITDGDKGASAYDGQELIEMPAYEEGEPILDKTGAGDAFSSGFLSAIIHNKSLHQAVKWGLINSSSVIRIVGATHGLINLEEMEDLTC